MYKLVITFSFSLLLSLSILTPVVVSLVDIDGDKIVMDDLTEKENKSEKEIEEKELVLHSFFDYEYQLELYSSQQFTHYLEGSSSFNSTILLPPPEYKA